MGSQDGINCDKLPKYCHKKSVFIIPGQLTLSQMTDFRLFQIESLQTTILNLMKMAESSQNG